MKLVHAARIRRSTHRAHVLPLVLLTGSLLCAGCRRTPKSAPPPTAAPDAGADASAAAAAALPFTGRVVARSVGMDMRLVRMKDDGLLVVSGPGMWSVGPGDALQRIGTPADAIPLLPAGDDELGGYDARIFELPDGTVWGPAPTPFVKPSDASALHWTGKEWTKTSASPMPEWRARYSSVGFDGEATKGLPEGYGWTARSEATRGVVAWLGNKPSTDIDARRIDEVFIGPTAGHAARAIAFPVEGGKPLKYRSCSFIESADDHTYVACVSSADLQGDFKHVMYVLDGERWTALDRALPESGERAFDAEGALWYAKSDDSGAARLVRVTRDGKEERFDVPAPPEGLSAPGYRSEDIPLESSTTQSSHTELRHWIATTIVPAGGPEAMDGIARIIPRRSGEVWVMGYDLGRDAATTSIVRYARSATGPAPMLVRSSADERRSVHEARGIRNWAGNCNTVFIPFPRAGREADAGDATSAFYADHKAAIDKAVAMSDRKGSDAAPLEVAIVEGRLGGRPVGGIVVIQSDPDADEKRLLPAIRKLGEIATPNPASPPAITCTLPELDRIVNRLRTAEPRHY